VILLTEGLARLGYETRLLVGRESPIEGNLFALAESKGVQCETLPALGREIRPLSDLRSLFALIGLMRSFRPAIVHTHAAKAGLLGRVAARLTGVPVVVHTFHGHVLRGYFGPVRERFFRLLERLLARLSDIIITVSEAIKQDLVDLRVAGRDHIRVVPLGLELAPLSGTLERGILRAELGWSRDAPVVGMVGRLVPIKDVPTFLRAAAIVRDARPDVRFVLVGDGEERELLECTCRSLRLEGELRFLGWRRDLAAIYGDLDVAVNSSLNEGTPVSLIEALAAGCPVVATRVGGTANLLGDGAYGRLVPPGDPEALAGGILEVLSAPAEVLRRADAGRAHALANYGSERLVADVDLLYQGLLRAKGLAA
jgi:glycosyltransferase involved in cell wall biosynthesis